VVCRSITWNPFLDILEANRGFKPLRFHFHGIVQRPEKVSVAWKPDPGNKKMLFGPNKPPRRFVDSHSSLRFSNDCPLF
jgi:hypothetical protein